MLIKHCVMSFHDYRKLKQKDEKIQEDHKETDGQTN